MNCVNYITRQEAAVIATGILDKAQNLSGKQSGQKVKEKEKSPWLSRSDGPAGKLGAFSQAPCFLLGKIPLTTAQSGPIIPLQDLVPSS